jgi:acylphosphatase
MKARAMFVISGRVQGVGYRAWAQGEAERLELVGWVRNTPDGRVEGEAEGPREAVERFLERCRSGPTFSRVRDVEVTWAEAVEGEGGFEVRR